MSKLCELIAKLLSVFESLDGVPSMRIDRSEGVMTIYHDNTPSEPTSMAEKRCLGSFSDKWEDECGVVFCSICHQAASLCHQFNTAGRRLNPVIALHYTKAVRNCAECDGGIWDEHYLCEACRVQ